MSKYSLKKRGRPSKSKSNSRSSIKMMQKKSIGKSVSSISSISKRKYTKSISKNSKDSSVKKDKTTNYGNKKFVNEYLKKITTFLPVTKVPCYICKKELSQIIRTITVTFKSYCIDCVASGAIKEDYFIIDKMNFPIFNADWTLNDEIQLLNCLEKFGIDNWSEIENFMKKKDKISIESHYYNYFFQEDKENQSNLDGIQNDEDKKYSNKIIPDISEFAIDLSSSTPTFMKEIGKQNKANEDKLKDKLNKIKGELPENSSTKDTKVSNRSRVLAKNRNKKESNNISSDEIPGYWPKREEFDYEYFNDAEIEIAELEFFDDDTVDAKVNKIIALEVYNSRLDEREKRKK